MNRARKISTHRQLTASFGLLVLSGAFLLMLPPMTHKGISFVDALFTSTSAVCVTGLAVVDTGAVFTRAGQLVILALIQLGGLGIMTFSTVILLMMGKKLSVSQYNLAGEVFSHSPMKNIPGLLLSIIAFTVGVEFMGFLVYLVSFAGRAPFAEAVFQAAFHAVSAFCNAGFSLFPDNLMTYKASIGVNLVTMCLIVIGGLGFFVLYELWRTYLSPEGRRERRRLSLHAKLACFTSAALIFGGAAVLFFLDYNRALSGLTLGEKVLASLFQSVSTRTAGFNTVDIAAFSNASILVMIALMFIGASPGSTGGGIKTTTFAVFFALIRSYLIGRQEPTAMNRTITPQTVARAMAVIVASALVVATGFMLLMIGELAFTPVEKSRVYVLPYIFECVSAFGTVGLSMGATPKFSAFGKIVLICLMFVGRLGPLTLASFVKQSQAKGGYSFSHEKVMIG